MDSCKLVPFARAPRGLHWAPSPHRSQPMLLSSKKQDWPFPTPRVCLSWILPMTHTSQNYWAAGKTGAGSGGWRVDPVSTTTISMSPASWKPDRSAHGVPLVFGSDLGSIFEGRWLVPGACPPSENKGKPFRLVLPRCRMGETPPHLVPLNAAARS